MKFYKTLITLFFINSIEAGISLVCLPAKNDGDGIGATMAAYLDIDGYSNRSVRTCSKGDCDDVDNFKYCKSPKPKFIIKAIGANGDVFVASNRCNSGFKKFNRIGEEDAEQNFLFEEKMSYQIKHQMWNSTSFVTQPVLELIKKEDHYELIIQDFIEDLWQIEWEREDIDISLFTVDEEDAVSYKTVCVSEDKFISIDHLKEIDLKKNKKRVQSNLNILKIKPDNPSQKKLKNINAVEPDGVGKLEVSLNPILKKSGELDYPIEAKKNSIEGAVTVIFDIDSYGNPKNIRIKETTNIIFNTSAIYATNSSLYQPALDKNRIPMYLKNLSVTYEFNL